MAEIRTVCLIGAGNVATHLADALHEAGYVIQAVFSRQIDHARQLAQKVGAGVAIDRLDQLPEADAYLFSVKDSVLDSLVRQVAHLPVNRQALFVHTAGSMPLTLLTPFFEHCAVLYPMQTFSKKRQLSFREIPLFIEADSPVSEAWVRDLACCISDRVQVLSSERRKKLHLSAVFACNFVNHCYSLAYSLLEKEGIDPTCLLPLIDETTRKIHEMSPHEAQTGPAVRWDENVMQSQMDQLKDFPELQTVYRAMSDSIHREFSEQV